MIPVPTARVREWGGGGKGEICHEFVLQHRVSPIECQYLPACLPRTCIRPFLRRHGIG